MKSYLKSVGKNFHGPALNRGIKGAVLFSLLLQVHCTIKVTHETPKEASSANNSGEVSLLDDRSHLSELRKDIPKDIRVRNDELAIILKLMGDPATKSPQKIRSQFEKYVRKERNHFRKKIKKTRKDFTKNERKKRSEFLKNAKKNRAEYLKGEHTSDEKKDFFSEQYDQNRSFFSEEREKRKDFESELREVSNEFNSNMREKIKAFNEQLVLYTKKYYELKKTKKQSKKNQFFQNRNSSLSSSQVPSPKESTTHQYSDEFEEMQNVPSRPLSTGGN